MDVPNIRPLNALHMKASGPCKIQVTAFKDFLVSGFSVQVSAWRFLTPDGEVFT